MPVVPVVTGIQGYYYNLKYTHTNALQVLIKGTELPRQSVRWQWHRRDSPRPGEPASATDSA